MSPGSSSRPPAASRPGRALRRRVLEGELDEGSGASDSDGGDGSTSDDVDIPSTPIDPRAVRFRAALDKIPDVDRGGEPREGGRPVAHTDPPTSTSQQVIDLDAIPAEPRLPNTDEVNLAERLKSVPDGTPLPAVRTRLSPRNRIGARTPVEEEAPGPEAGDDELGGGEERSVVDLRAEAPSPVSGSAPESPTEAEVGEAATGDLVAPADLELFEPEGSDVEVGSAPVRTRAKHSKATHARGKHSKGRSPKGRRTATSVPPRPPWWRRVAFAVTLCALVAAVPVLFVAGYRIVTRSTDGQLQFSTLSRNDPGYEELVTSTPTAVLTQLDAGGTPIGQTLLSLPNNGGGGSIVFIPLDTELAEPAFGVATFRTVVTMSPHPPAEVRDRVVPQIAKLLNAGIDDTFELDDAGWAQMVAPVGSIDIRNSDEVEVAGTWMPAGPVTLEPDQVGPYLGAMRWGENQLNQFVRQEEVWRSWLAAVAEAPDAVPGETDAGLGMFIRTLAAGPVTYLTLPGDYGVDGIYRSDEVGVRDLVVDHIPVPDPGSPGSRVMFRILEGVEPSEPSPDLVRQIVANRGSVAVVGNASSFDREVTDIVYSDPEMESSAIYMATVLGIGGEIVFDPMSSDAVDLTLIVGRDLHRPSGGT